MSLGVVYIYDYDDMGTEVGAYVDEKYDELKTEELENYLSEIADKPDEVIEEELKAKEREINNKNDLTNYLKYAAGDDCVRFGMAVYNYATEGKLFDLHKRIIDNMSVSNSKKARYNYGLTILCRDAARFVDINSDIDDWFSDLGYDRIEVDRDFDIEDLRPGDFLCSAPKGEREYGHVEFYLGYDYLVDEITD